jgi:hypothetical protein
MRTSATCVLGMTQLTIGCDSRHRCHFEKAANYVRGSKLWGACMSDERGLLEVLKAELQFLNSGGYRNGSWRPKFIFEDSPTCLNYGDSKKTKPCSECILMQFVPPEARENKIPCRHIPLNERGETIESLYRTGTQAELESAVRGWLIREIEKLERVPAPKAVAK